jgi:cyclophilin family peptidyl-prolyl cis-trans isomerase
MNSKKICRPRKITLLLLSVMMVFAFGCSNDDSKEEKSDESNAKSTEQTTTLKEQKMPERVKIDPSTFEDLSSQYKKAKLETNVGSIVVELFNEESPETVNNFLNLAKIDFYNGTIFHRVIKNFMIQGGDPLSKSDNKALHGTGDPGYKFEDEFNDEKLVRGSLAMANSGPNTNGSQFFIVTAKETPWLDGMHTNFGKVIEGMDIIDQIENTQTDQRDHPLKDIVIKNIELLEK